MRPRLNQLKQSRCPLAVRCSAALLSRLSHITAGGCETSLTFAPRQIGDTEARAGGAQLVLLLRVPRRAGPHHGSRTGPLPRKTTDRCKASTTDGLSVPAVVRHEARPSAHPSAKLALPRRLSTVRAVSPGRRMSKFLSQPPVLRCTRVATRGRVADRTRGMTQRSFDCSMREQAF